MDFRTLGSLLLLMLLLRQGACAAQQVEDPSSDSDGDLETSLDSDLGEEPEEEDMTATILRTNKESEMFLLEGDIEIPTNRNARKCYASPTSCHWPKKGKYVQVPYTLSEKYDKDMQGLIKAGMREIQQKTCVRFVQRSGQRSYVDIVPGGRCSSSVGRTGERQRVSLRAPSCLKHGIIIHELLHALGFYHEHTRSDRDQYVIINWDNMHRFNKRNFQMRESDNLKTPYDYTSVMHYGRTAFAQRGKETIVPLQENVSIGQREYLSDMDTLRINKLYRC